MTTNPRKPSQPVRMPDACREFLTRRLAGEQATGHEADCPACAARVALHGRLIAGLSVRPKPPAHPSIAEQLEATHERIVERAEGPGGLSALLGRGARMPEAAPVLPEPLLESELPHVVRTVPSTPSELDWSRVRRDVTVRVTEHRTARRLRRLLVSAAGVAAAAALAFWLQSSGTKTEATIVFLDLEKPPSADYPWLGGTR